ncbi:hypothetical protein HMPREF0208_04226 [Citrobacter koseri]|nr:hypothetical protein HMPREF3207_02026 [Citrobacter koseri]KXB40530.1 hypothetical protein HMPREF0208_04226 [Citrobacter koseri]
MGKELCRLTIENKLLFFTLEAYTIIKEEVNMSRYLWFSST